jgi:16S rRNA (guanine(966)-N(2))-methyltransferase RsmD
VRIIAGELRGRRLDAPAGKGTRPMLDRVREAVCATLQPWFQGALVLDLFAGTGSLGLEALSRGAARVRFVERDPRVVRVLLANVSTLGVEGRVEVVGSDALVPSSWIFDAAVAGAHHAPDGRPGADLVFFDPPYGSLDRLAGQRDLFAALDTLVRRRLAPQGILLLHAPRHRLHAGEFARDLVVRRRHYGTSDVWYVQAAQAGATSPEPRSTMHEDGER